MDLDEDDIEDNSSMKKYWEKDNATHIFFYGGVLSNWHPAEFHSNFSADGELIKFNCSEQYFMAAKAKFFKDEEIYELIMKQDYPSDQKYLGKQIRNFDENIWFSKARDIMYVGLYDKFYQNDKLFSILISTGKKILVEASPSDKLWGIGLQPHDPTAIFPNRWKGKNWLGQVLGKVRDDLIAGEENSFKEIKWS
jgi:ribA/ribD-fused uncharacterized protein